MAASWPDRDTWARQRRCVYIDEIETVRAGLRFALSDTAAAELRTFRNGPLLGQLRDHKALLDQHGYKLPYRRTKESRAEIYRLVKRHAWGEDAIDLNVIDTIGRGDETCPHWNDLVDRAHTAADDAVRQLHIRKENAPIDDDAWNVELDRRKRVDSRRGVHFRSETEGENR